MGAPASPLEKRRVTVSKRQKMQREILLAELRKNSIMTVACQKAGIPRSTVYRWMNDDPKFMDLTDQAVSEGRDTINDMAESVIIKKVREENLLAAKYYLSHNNERYKPWRNRFADNINSHEVRLMKERLKNFFDSVFRKRKKQGR
jgi:hypothetical protein